MPTVLVAFAESPWKASIVAVFYTIPQTIEGFVITPNVHRRIIALPPVLVLATQIVMASLVGAIGVILAMPLVAFCIVLVQTLYIETVLGESKQDKGI